ncbi:hypothetical protein RND71_015397 [Anisodus tanguticus]|uniref:F-box domain-containing protein n=1 Tax=Anisodus tanguticus TaxID=243964 RepID=A0AAE1S6U3_9SOLA|nr:hypothetical protein RND71_015397 [Anisodus tanguticus]
MISADPPGDEMTNILSRLPVEALMQLRSVCKSWCNLIRDPHFVNMHMNQHSSYKESGYLIGKDIILDFAEIEECKDTTLDVAEIKECCTLYSDETFAEHKKMEFPLWESTKSFQIIGCCNGVLFLVYPLTPRSCCKMYFCNPATKIIKNLSNSPVQLPDVRVHVAFGFGWVPWLDEYKVVRILYSEQMNLIDPPKHPPVVEIYSLKTDSWTKIEIELSYFIISHTAEAFLDGCAYWVARKVINKNDFVVFFNMADHVFEEIKLPSCLGDGALTGSNGEVVFESIEGHLSLYDPRNQQFQDLHFQENPYIIELFAYKESLVLLDLGTEYWPSEFHDDGNEELESQTQESRNLRR